MIFALAVLGLLAAVVLWTARPWETPGASWVDRFRVADAVSKYDFWLGVHGVGGRRRRALRDELRANLWDAARRLGGRAAVAGLGPTRRLAADVAREGAATTGPRWGQGLAAGLVALECVVAVQLLVLTAVADAARAADLPRLEVPVTLVPGMRATYERLGDGFSFGADLGPAPFVVGLLVFVVAARPWRLVRRGVSAGRPRSA